MVQDPFMATSEVVQDVVPIEDVTENIVSEIQHEVVESESLRRSSRPRKPLLWMNNFVANTSTSN